MRAGAGAAGGAALDVCGIWVGCVSDVAGWRSVWGAGGADVGVWGEGVVGGCGCGGELVSGARLERVAPQLVLLSLAAAVLGQL